MRFLVITHDYPPVMSPRAFRWSAVCEQLARTGHDVDVVAAWLPGTPREETDLVSVTRVGSRLLAKVRNRLGTDPPRIGDDSTCEVAKAAAGRGTSIPRKAASRLAGGLWKSVRWPDTACPFILPALKAAGRLIRDKPYDVLVTVSHPFSCHLPGLVLKRRHPQLQWLVDIGDPFAFALAPNNRRLYSRLNDRVEAAVLTAADSVSVTTRGMLEGYLADYALTQEKFAVIPPLLSIPKEDVGRQPVSSCLTDNNRLRLVYCGRWYRQIRNPVYLLELLKKTVESASLKRRLELHLYGGVGDCGELIDSYRDLQGKHLFLHSLVDRTETVAAMRNADVLVNVGNPNAQQLPSKIVEYIGMRKAIINLVNHPKDCTLELLQEHPALLNLACGQATLEKNVVLLLEFLERLPISISESVFQRIRTPFLPASIAAAYIELATRGNRNSPDHRARAPKRELSIRHC
jgi:glycosyltransferase involved in cell wall biosynthesis